MQQEAQPGNPGRSALQPHHTQLVEKHETTRIPDALICRTFPRDEAFTFMDRLERIRHWRSAVVARAPILCFPYPEVASTVPDRGIVIRDQPPTRRKQMGENHRKKKIGPESGVTRRHFLTGAGIGAVGLAAGAPPVGGADKTDSAPTIGCGTARAVPGG